MNANWRDALASAGLADSDAIFRFQSGGSGDGSARASSLTKPGLPPTRQRDRVVLPDGRTIYLKRYRPTWGQRISRLLKPGRYGSEARDEWHALHRLAGGNVPVPEPVLLGESGPARAATRSCIALAELPDATSLERWLPAHGPHLTPEQRRRLLDRLADFVAHFHSLGLVHRDLYLSHVFIRWPLPPSVDGRGQGEGEPGGGGGLHHLQAPSPSNRGSETADPIYWLIDLARVFKPAGWRRRRWIVKDLASLRYSLGEMISSAEWDAFLARYGGPGGLARSVAGKVQAIRRHDERRARRSKNSFAGI